MPHAIFVDPDITWIKTISRARERGMQAIAIQSERYAHAYPMIRESVDGHITANTSHLLDLSNSIQKIHLSDSTALLTSNDAILPVLAAVAEKLNIPFTSCVGVNFARNKAAMRRRMGELGFRMPRMETFEKPQEVLEVAESIGYPCIVKPCSGHQSWLCFKILSSDERIRVAEELEYMVDNIFSESTWSLKNGFICEEWLEGPVMSVSIAASLGCLVPVSVALGSVSDDAPCSGFGSVIPFIENPRVTEECERYAASVCVALNLDIGVFDIEMAWTSNGPILIEVNARRMGGVMPVAYEMATGENFSDFLLNAYLGKSINKPPNSTRTAVIRKVIASESTKLPDGFDESWWSKFDGELYYRNYSLESGRNIDALEVLARIILIDSNSITAFSKLNQIVAKLEEITGKIFLRGRLPWPKNY